MNNNFELLNINDKNIYLVGTAHISNISVNDVSEIIREVNPDSIAIELDDERYQKLTKPSNYENQNIYTIIKNKQANFLLANIILASFQKKMAKNLNSVSGNEMIEAIKLSNELNCNLELIDRNIGLTFSRIWGSLKFFEKCKLLATIISSIFDNEEITEEDLENLKSGDALNAALTDISKSFPNVKRVLVDERDMFLAHKIRNAKGTTIVAVVGAAHIPGIKKHITSNYSIDEINKKIEKGALSKLYKWIIPVALISLIAYMFVVNFESGLQELKNWFLINGAFSAIGVLIVGGHPLSVLTALIAAPFTSMNPLLAAGFFAGISEAWIRKPTAKDFEMLAEDATTLKGFYKNRVTKILLVVFMANVFSSIGTFVSGADIIKNLIKITK